MSSNGFKINDKDGYKAFSGPIINGNFLLQEQPEYPSYSVKLTQATQPASWDQWHRRLGHAGMSTVKLTANATVGIDYTQAQKEQQKEPPHDKCEACIQGKMVKAKSHSIKRNKQAIKPGERWYIDIAGGGKITPTIGGAKYLLTFTDEKTDRIEYFLLQEHSANTIQRCLFQFITKPSLKDIKISFIRSDNAREFTSPIIQEYAREMKIVWEFTAPYSSHQNGVAERHHRTIFEKVRAVLYDAGMEEQFWGEAVNYVVYTRDRIPSRTSGKKTTPHEAWYGVKPSIEHLRPFGCICWAYNHEAYEKKLTHRGIKCRLLGYGARNQYRLWNVEKKQVHTSAYVIFDETRPMRGEEDLAQPIGSTEDGTQMDSSSMGNMTGSTVSTSAQLNDSHISHEAPEASTGPSPGSLEATQVTTVSPETPRIVEIEEGDILDNIQEAIHTEDIAKTPPALSEDPVIGPKLGDINNLGASNDTAPEEHTGAPRRSNRNHKTYDYSDLNRGNRRTFYTRAAQLPKAPHDLPKTIHEALAGPQKAQWKEACNQELQALESKSVWTLVDAPPGRKVLKGRWVLNIKLQADGTIARYKARWVAKGFEQIEGIDFFDTFSSVVKTASWRVLLAIGTQFDMEIEHSDVDTAYLEAKLQEEVFIEQPHAFKKGNKVCRLHKALYGLKQSAREWYDTLKKRLEEMGYTSIQKDHAVFIHQNNGSIIATYVDDLLILAHTRDTMNDIKASLDKRFKLKHLGTVSHYLGMQVFRNREKKEMFITQKGYIGQLIEQLGMEDCHTVMSPIDKNMLLGQPQEGYEAPYELKHAYASLIGALNWIAAMTRPDIAFAVHKLSTYLVQPTEEHLQAAKRLIRYLAGTIELGINYRPNSHNNGGLIGYTDSSWHDDNNNGRSTSAYLFKLWNGPISWRSRQQPIVAMSSAEAEYVSAAEACQEALYLRDLMYELHHVLERVTLRVDNTAAIRMANNPVNHSKAKHMRLRYHFVRQLVQQGEVYMEWISTEGQAADPLTKGMLAKSLKHTCMLLGLSTSLEGTCTAS